MTLAAIAARRKRVPDPDDLLAWYDRHRRDLPWRAAPGDVPDPYRVWLSEIMLQQTGVRTVVPYYARFLARFPTVADLAAAPLKDVLHLWAGLGYYARARNLHACAKALLEGFPEAEAALAELPGVGPYTAAAIAAIAFGARATPVDGNVGRVIARLFACTERPARPAVRRLAQALTPKQRPGDFAQALMDLGATVCTPKHPSCARCPWQSACAGFACGEPEAFPRKIRRRARRWRRGAAFVVLRQDQCVLVRTRPVASLLGGMTEVPTSAWTQKFDIARALETAPFKAQWHCLPGAVTHGFTHFPLRLAVYVTEVPGRRRAPPGMRFVRLDELDREALPTLMRKVLAHAGVNGRAFRSA